MVSDDATITPIIPNRDAYILTEDEKTFSDNLLSCKYSVTLKSDSTNVCSYTMSFLLGENVATLKMVETEKGNLFNGLSSKYAAEENIILIFPDTITYLNTTYDVIDLPAGSDRVFRLNKSDLDGKSPLTEVYLSSAIKKLNAQEFSYNQDLKAIDLGNVEEIVNLNFSINTKINYLKFPDSITSIGTAGLSDNVKFVHFDENFVATNFFTTSAIFTSCAQSNIYLSDINTTLNNPLQLSLGFNKTSSVSLPSHLKITGSNSDYYTSNNEVGATISFEDTVYIEYPSGFTCDNRYVFNITLTDFWINNNLDEFFKLKSHFPNATFVFYAVDGSVPEFIFSDTDSSKLVLCLSNSESVTILASVTEIGDGAFQDCTSLKTINFENGSQLSRIGAESFRSSGLESVTIPASVTEIGDGAFQDCTSLKTINFEDDSQLSKIGAESFRSSGLESVTIPASVTEIGNYAFSECNSLNNVTFEDDSQLSKIGVYAFYVNPLLKTLTIPLDNIENLNVNLVTPLYTELLFTGTPNESSGLDKVIISDVTFYAQKNSEHKYVLIYASKSDLTNKEIVINDEDNIASVSNVFYMSPIKSIKMPAIDLGRSAFFFSTSLESVTFTGDGGIKIGDGAFQGCTSLSDVEFEGNPQSLTIGDKSFSSCPITSIYLPAGLTSLSGSAFSGCNSLENISIDENCVNYKVENNLVLGGSGFSKLIFAPASLTEIIIPNSVKSLDVGTANTVPFFKNNSNITSVTFSEGCTLSICDDAFYNCTGLTEVTFNEGCSISSIGDNAFANTGISYITIPASVNSIGDRAFINCLSLVTVKFSEGSKISSIGEEVFSKCNQLSVITIPASIISIGDDAFLGCTSLFLNDSHDFAVDTSNDTYTLTSDGLLLEKDGDSYKIIFVCPNVKEIYIDANVTSYSSNAFENNTITGITVNDANPMWVSIGGKALATIENTDLLLVGGGVVDLDITGVSEIPKYGAFFYAKSLKHISWSGEKLTLGYNAISKISTLDSIHFVAKDTIYLNEFAINGCNNLKSIYLSAATLQLTGRESTDGYTSQGVIYGCTSENLKIEMNCNKLIGSNKTIVQACNGLSEFISSAELTMDNPFRGTFSNFSAMINNVNTDAMKLICGEIDLKSDLPGFSYNIESIEVGSSTLSFSFSFKTDNQHTPWDVTIDAGSVSYSKTASGVTVCLDGKADSEFNLIINEITSGDKITITLDPSFSGFDVKEFEIFKGTTILPSILEEKTSAFTSDTHVIRGWYTDPAFKYEYSQTPFESDATLYAKWNLLDGCEIIFSNLKGNVDAYYVQESSNIYLISGDKISNNCSISVTLTPYVGYEFLHWDIIVIDKSGTETTYSEYNTLNIKLDLADLVSDASRISFEPVYRYYSTSNSLINVVYSPEAPKTGDDIIHLWNYYSGKVDTSMGVWTGFPSIPLIVEDYVFIRANDTLYKLDLYSGNTIGYVTTSNTTVKAYYHYLGYGGGFIFDYATQKIYDINLKEVASPVTLKFSAVFYNDGYFYGCSNGKLWKFAPGYNVESNEYWADGVDISWHSLYGTTSTPVFDNGKIYFIEIYGSERHIASIDLDSGEKNTIRLKNLDNLLIDDGWLTHYDHNGTQYLFVTGYNQGLFEDSKGNAVIAYVQLDNSGDFLQDSEKSIIIPDYSGTASAFVIYNGRGYINVTGSSQTSSQAQFYVYDVAGLLSDNTQNSEWDAKTAHNKYLIWHSDSIKSHGSIVLNAANASTTGMVYVYILPYEPNDQALFIFEDYSGKRAASDDKYISNGYYKTSAAGSSYGSQAVRIGPNGVLLWYTDSGRMYCYGMEDQSKYYIMIQNDSSAEWKEVSGKDAADALSTLGYSVSENNLTYGGSNYDLYRFLDSELGWRKISTYTSTALNSTRYFIITNENATAKIDDTWYFKNDAGKISACTTNDIFGDKTIVDKSLFSTIFDIDVKYHINGNTTELSVTAEPTGIYSKNIVWVSAYIKYGDDTCVMTQSSTSIVAGKCSFTLNSFIGTASNNSTPAEYLVLLWDSDPKDKTAVLCASEFDYITLGDSI